MRVSLQYFKDDLHKIYVVKLSRIGFHELLKIIIMIIYYICFKKNILFLLQKLFKSYKF